MFLGLTVWYWLTSWCDLPWGRLFSRSHHSLVAWVLCLELKPHELSLHMLAHVSVPSMLSACWGMHVGETFGCSFWHSPERLSHSKFPGPLALTVFLPSLPKWLPSLRLRSWVADLSAGTALHNSAFWLIVIFCTSLHLSPASFYIKLEGLKNEMA